MKIYNRRKIESNKLRPTSKHNPIKYKFNKNRLNNRDWNQTKPNTVKHTHDAHIKSFLLERAHTPDAPIMKSRSRRRKHDVIRKHVNYGTWPEFNLFQFEFWRRRASQDDIL